MRMFKDYKLRNGELVISPNKYISSRTCCLFTFLSFLHLQLNSYSLLTSFLSRPLTLSHLNPPIFVQLSMQPWKHDSWVILITLLLEFICSSSQLFKLIFSSCNWEFCFSSLSSVMHVWFAAANLEISWRIGMSWNWGLSIDKGLSYYMKLGAGAVCKSWQKWISCLVNSEFVEVSCLLNLNFMLVQELIVRFRLFVAEFYGN